ncbi:MAG: ABC transporter ATP-binding protein [Beijerinckiaceae bacterium]|jgi:peptide/nickel transport system ATP-binding protein|nr:ABC transporter ATP-binding protein [Beijerinckiaceae bacterium]
MNALLRVENLTVSFGTPRGGRVLAVDGLSFELQPGRTLGIVGESGSGKSVTSLAVMGLLAKGAARVDGEIRFRGDSLIDAPAETLRDLRGNRMAMIFQEPMTSLNPSHRIGDQIAEAVIRHRGWSHDRAWSHAVEMLRKVRIPEPEARAADYPHKLSGGMRQRAMIAMALACDPELLIADEPTTALDVTIQAQILELLQDLRLETGAAVILITHDLGVVAEVVDEVLVMYAGQVVERASVEALFTLPQHPYTLGLLGSIPRLDIRKERLAAISGAVPDMSNPPPGCRFAARCPFADARCRAEAPPLAALGDNRFSRCWKAPLEELAA